MSGWMRMLGLALALAGAGACRGPTAPTAVPAPTGTGDRARADAAPVEPDLCHASVGWREGRFEVVGLPCVSRDGAELLFARSDEPPRPPALIVAAVSRADQLTRYAAVMEPHERELLDAGRRPTPELGARIVKANVMLTEASRRAVPLAVYAATAAGTHAGQGLEIAWTEQGRLTISREGRFVHEGDYGRWLEPAAACAPYLDRVWGDAGRGVLLVKIAYRGGGSGGCAAVPSLHAIPWTP